MTQMAVATSHKPIWIDLATQDAEASRKFYAELFGWQIDVNPDPQYGGYGRALLGGQDIAGIGPAQSSDQPTACRPTSGRTTPSRPPSRSRPPAGR